jgi:cytoskeletal protein CcmA (bactofilin family)
MFGRNAKHEIDSHVGAAAKVRGDLTFSGGLHVDGEVHGNVTAADGPDQVLVVSEQGRIVGEVRCANIVVNGTIEGPVFSSGQLELQAKGRILGDVQYKLLEMHGGAAVTGKLQHQAGVEPVFHLGTPEAVPQRAPRQQSIMDAT